MWMINFFGQQVEFVCFKETFPFLTYKKSAERPLECCQKFRFPMNFNMVPNNFFVGFGGKSFNT